MDDDAYKARLRHWASDQLREENERLENENSRLRIFLEWLDRRGGLGLDTHERIRQTLKQHGND